MRAIRLPLLPALLAGVLLLACAGSAPAASFPCKSFVHQLRHGKLHDAIQGEGVVSQQVARFKKGVARDEASNLPEPTKTGKINSDKRKLAEWTAHLRYLKALDARIGQENCSKFNYHGVIAWIKHRSGHLHADRFKLAGNPSPKAARQIAYDTGGLEALDPAGVRIKQIAAQHGVRIAAAADARMPGPPAPPTLVWVHMVLSVQRGHSFSSRVLLAGSSGSTR